MTRKPPRNFFQEFLESLCQAAVQEPRSNSSTLYSWRLVRVELEMEMMLPYT